MRRVRRSYWQKNTENIMYAGRAIKGIALPHQILEKVFPSRFLSLPFPRPSFVSHSHFLQSPHGTSTVAVPPAPSSPLPHIFVQVFLQPHFVPLPLPHPPQPRSVDRYFLIDPSSFLSFFTPSLTHTGPSAVASFFFLNSQPRYITRYHTHTLHHLTVLSVLPHPSSLHAPIPLPFHLSSSRFAALSRNILPHTPPYSLTVHNAHNRARRRRISHCNLFGCGKAVKAIISKFTHQKRESRRRITHQSTCSTRARTSVRFPRSSGDKEQDD
jgi:hypothetical protein